MPRHHRAVLLLAAPALLCWLRLTSHSYNSRSPRTSLCRILAFSESDSSAGLTCRRLGRSVPAIYRKPPPSRYRYGRVWPAVALPESKSVAEHAGKKGIALFVDGDQVHGPYVHKVLEALGPLRDEYGEVVAIKAFTPKHWLEHDQAWGNKSLVNELGIEIELAPHAVDGADTALSEAVHEWCNVSTIAIASNDRGFIQTMQSVKDSGQNVVAVSMNSGLSLVFQVVESQAYSGIADAQVSWSTLEESSRKQHTHAVQLQGKKDGFTVTLRSQKVKQMAMTGETGLRTMRRMCKYVVRRLSQLGYFQMDEVIPDAQLKLAAGLALFHFGNGLDGFRIFPYEDGLLQTYKLLQTNPHRKWKERPRGSICVFPQGNKVQHSLRERFGKSAFPKILAAGGPFIMKRGRESVRNFLCRLGFLQKFEQVSDCALELFSERNAKLLHAAGFGKLLSIRCLERILACDDHVQLWRTTGKDDHVRAILRSAGFLKFQNDSIDAVKRGAAEYLAAKGQDVDDLLGKCYAWHIEAVLRYQNRNAAAQPAAAPSKGRHKTGDLTFLP